MFMSKHNSGIFNGGSRVATATAILAMTFAPACIGQLPVAGIRASVVETPPVPNALGSTSRMASDGKTLHVTVGHSIFIDTKTRLRRVYVADPTVLNSVTLSPTQIIVTAMNAGLSSLTLLDENNQAQSYVVSSDLDIDGLRAAMSQAMRGDGVKVDGIGGRVTLSGTVTSDAMADAAVKLAGLYSKEVANALTVSPVHPKQVRLEVRILEVDRSKMLQLGINIFNPGGNTSFLASSTSAQFPTSSVLSQGVAGAIGTLTTSNPLSFLLYSAKLNLGVTIQDLQTKQVLQVLAEPTLTTISGQKAEFLSGGEFPFPVVQPGSGGSAPVISVQFRQFGVKVEFTPVVNEDGTIRMKVTPEVSALDYTNSVSVDGTTIPSLSTRKANTEVELRSNQSFAISGLLDQRTTDIMSKNPGAANIPILGYLFKSKNVNHATTELVVVVTPTVVDPLSEPATPAQPELPIRPLDVNGFDQSLGKNLNPNPQPPPLGSGRPPFGNEDVAPAPAPAPIAPTKGAFQAAPAKVPGGMPAATAPVHAKTETLVEIMTLSHEADAEVMVAALKRHGYDIAVNHEPQDSLLHLDIGPFANKKDAETMRQRLILDGYNATIK
jgi:pilus assembly protein CpaC